MAGGSDCGYRFCTDSESGVIAAESLEAALEKVSPTEAAIRDGAFAWVEDSEGRRLYVAEQNAF